MFRYINIIKIYCIYNSKSFTEPNRKKSFFKIRFVSMFIIINFSHKLKNACIQTPLSLNLNVGRLKNIKPIIIYLQVNNKTKLFSLCMIRW